jgi:hypothetical protein
VEDRLTAGLYLELLDADPDDYRRVRVPELAALPGADGVTLWANLRPGRTELPMKVPDGTLLAVVETTGTFRPPTAEVGATAFHFTRYPRPSQGCLTGRPTTGLLVVWISPKRPELAQALRDWADFIHLRHIAAAGVEGYTEITPYENVASGAPQFMHFYEMDADDPEKAYQAMPLQVAARLGGQDSAVYREWADLSAAGGHLVYCNTFRRLP